MAAPKARAVTIMAVLERCILAGLQIDYFREYRGTVSTDSLAPAQVCREAKGIPRNNAIKRVVQSSRIKGMKDVLERSV